MVKAGKKDIVTAIFILLHENEKTGWIERNAKREFFAHADTLLASESSLKKAIKILLDAIPDARRIGTKVDFEVIKHCCVTVSRRDTFIFNKTAEEYLAKEFHHRDSNPGRPKCTPRRLRSTIGLDPLPDMTGR